MALSEIINSSKGHWSTEISDFDYAMLKNISENYDSEILSEEILEGSLEQLPVKKGKTKWLKKTICEIIRDPETEKAVSSVPIENSRAKLLEIITDAILAAFPGMNVVGKAVIKIIIYLLKRAFKKGIENWCE